MSFFSLLKSLVLRSADALNKTVGGPQPFTRLALPDPSGVFSSDYVRRDAIADAAELELEHFMSGGFFVQSTPNDLGDAAIWQGVYAAMTVMRWRVRPDLGTKTAMVSATAALANYLHNGVLCRGAIPKELEGGLFHRDATKVYYDENGFIYREDASLDSLLGVMFGMAVVQRWGNEASKAAILEPLKAFSKVFTLSGYRITNRNGSVTTYGDCAPGLFQAPVRILAAAFPSLLAGTDEWQSIARTYAPEFSATDTQIPGKISWVNAHLAILANLTFVAATPLTAPGRGQAIDGLRTLIDKYADAGNSFLIFAAAALGVCGTNSQLDKAARVLLEFPLGAKPKSGLNSSTAPSLQPVPVWQRPPADVIWQRSPYPYSGSEAADYNRMDYLLAHFFDRFHQGV